MQTTVNSSRDDIGREDEVAAGSADYDAKDGVVGTSAEGELPVNTDGDGRTRDALAEEELAANIGAKPAPMKKKSALLTDGRVCEV